MKPSFPSHKPAQALALGAIPGALAAATLLLPATPAPAVDPEPFAAVKRIVDSRCTPCHNPKDNQGALDLARFRTGSDLRNDPKPWVHVVEQVEAGQMPPSGSKPLTPAEKRVLLDTVRRLLDDEARSRKDDPGVVPVRRLSNSEYDNPIRDLTGVDLKPTRQFPPDGAGGEGFTNASEALGEISPALLEKYVAAARDIAAHAVFTPTGLRFSPSTTRRDWSDEGVARLQAFYKRYAGGEGRFDPAPLLKAAIAHRDSLRTGKTTVGAIAKRENVNARHLGRLIDVLMDTPGAGDSPAGRVFEPLRNRFRNATPADLPALVAEVDALRNALWTEVRIGNYIRNVGDGYAESVSRQLAVDPPATAEGSVRVPLQPMPGSSDVVVNLIARDLDPAASGAPVVWKNLRLESPSKPPLHLADYPQFGTRYEVDPRSLFAGTAAYLDAIANSQPGSTPPAGLDPQLLARWNELAGVRQGTDAVEPALLGKAVRAVNLSPLSEKIIDDGGRKGISGWRKAGSDLPAVISNATDDEMRIPGLVKPHRVVAHPLPTEFVGVVWTSPVDALVALDARVAHAHPDCGNGIAWFTEHRRGDRATVFFEDRVPLGGKSQAPTVRFRVAAGDRILLGVDAKDGNHGCDLTDVEFTISEIGGKRRWDLAADVADNILVGNPHAGRGGDANVWAFVSGPSRSVAAGAAGLIPPGSALARWQETVLAKGPGADSTASAKAVETLLTGPRPTSPGPDQALYDQWVGIDSPLFTGIDTVRIAAGKRAAGPFALPASRFDNSGHVPGRSGETIAVRLPASLAAGRTLIAETAVPGGPGNRVVRVGAGVSLSPEKLRWDSAVVGDPKGSGYASLKASWARLRDVFPKFVCFPAVIPTDEVVSLKMFHREDQALMQNLSGAERTVLENLWIEHRFVSRQAVAEEAYLPQFIGFVSQDQPKAMLDYFNNQRPVFLARKQAWEADSKLARPRQLEAVLAFAAKAFRRPLRPDEAAAIRRRVQRTTTGKTEFEDSLRSALVGILTSPNFLFRIETPPPGDKPRPLGQWEIATRLSYFLWSSAPDQTLRELAAAGKLNNPDVLKAQARRMVRDPKARALAIEFGAQSLHVKDFDTFNEKNEALFPEFDTALKRDLYEETILFFLDFFQSDRPVAWLLDSDSVFVNNRVAKHYGIPGVDGEQFRKVDGARRYGRGGILALASVQAKAAAASRTSPVLRGNWVSETLLGEKLPKPPPNVPQLPETENSGSLTVRQITERHAKDPACWSCHQRIDPIGFTFEAYDSIGRKRTRDTAGKPIDDRTTLRDGSKLAGLDGLRTWLLTRKRNTVVRVFCQRLLGYALGRSTTLADTHRIDQLARLATRPGATVGDLLETIVVSPQFTQARGGRDSRGIGTMAQIESEGFR